MANYYDYLPRYHQIEVNLLKGLYTGFMVAQMEVADDYKGIITNSTTGQRLVENGNIATISADGITNVANKDDALFLVYTEPQVPFGPQSPKMYATNIDKENVRLVQLIPGDEWMTDFDYFKDEAYTDVAALLEGRIVEITADSKMSRDNFFKVTTLPDGTAAHHYLFVK